MRFSKKAKAAVLAATMALGVIGGAYAYFSGTAATVSNTFNIVAGEKDQEGNAGTITENKWNPDNAKDLEPGETVAKNPVLTSNVDYESWAFIKVEIPTISAQKDGDTADKVYDAVTLGTINSGFTKIKEQVSTTAGTDSVYIYGYNSKLAADAATPELFTDFTVQDFTKCGALTGTIDVSGTMIQTTGYETLDAAATALGLK